MSNAQKQQARTTQTDSLFGMVLATAFLGVAYGSAVSQAMTAGEMCSAVYEDRMGQKRTNGRGVYELNVKGKLAGTFTCKSLKNDPAPAAAPFDAWMKPAPRGYALAF